MPRKRKKIKSRKSSQNPLAKIIKQQGTKAIKGFLNPKRPNKPVLAPPRRRTRPGLL